MRLENQGRVLIGSGLMKCLAAILRRCGDSQTNPIQIESISIPQLKRGQVRVRMNFAGICGTQLLEVRGKKGPDRFLPHLLGHEGSGKVEAVGPEVTKVKVGDHVVLSWIKGTGLNSENPTYTNDAGETINAGPAAVFIEVATVSENRCFPLPKEAPLDEAALLGCALPTGAGMVRRELGCRQGNSVAVFGVGGVGLSAVMMAKAAGCHPIYAVDVRPEKIEFAKTLGASHGVNSLQDAPMKNQVDFAIEASGSAQAMQAAVESVKTLGGICLLAGNLAKGEKIQVDPYDLIFGKTLKGSAGGNTALDEDLPAYWDLMQTGRLPLRKMIHSRIKLCDLSNALNELENGKIQGRILIAF